MVQINKRSVLAWWFLYPGLPIRIRMVWSDPDLGDMVRSSSRCYGRIRIWVIWSDPILGVMDGSGSGWYGRIRIWVVWSAPDLGSMVGSGSWMLWSDPDLSGLKMVESSGFKDFGRIRLRILKMYDLNMDPVWKSCFKIPLNCTFISTLINKSNNISNKSTFILKEKIKWWIVLKPDTAGFSFLDGPRQIRVRSARIRNPVCIISRHLSCSPYQKFAMSYSAAAWRGVGGKGQDLQYLSFPIP